MAKTPEVCAPVNARTLYEATLDEALHTLCQAISGRLNALLVAICVLCGRSAPPRSPPTSSGATASRRHVLSLWIQPQSAL